MGPPVQMIRVFVVADIRLYREGLAQLLARERRFSIVGSAARQDEDLARLCDARPEIVLLDMAMAGSMALIRKIIAGAPDVKVVALAVAETDHDIIPCAEAGVAGYVSRDGSTSDLIATIDSVVCGETLCSPRIAATLLRRVAALAAERHAAAPVANLTPRQREIVGLIGQGLSNKEIARRLCIELSTVKNHVHSTLEKLGTHRRAEAVALLGRTDFSEMPRGPVA
jgi:two-component system, NarL family, nitrate/nitrite response regulator NarL